MDNKQIAAILNETADLMEITGTDAFRVRSFRNAASAVDSYPERIADIAADPSRDLAEIKGIGNSIKCVIEELLEHGSFERRDKLLEKCPPTALEFLKIQGLGPKTIALIYECYRVSTIDGLEQLCRDGKLRSLPRMGEKQEQRILRGIEAYKRNAGRFLIDFVDRTAGELIDDLKDTPGLEKIAPAGSLRRGKETIGDLDLLVTAADPKAVLDRFVKHSCVDEVLGHGETKASARVKPAGLQVDVRAVDAESYGAALLYFTGSKDHNVALRDRAIKLGLRLNEYALARMSDGEHVAGETEESIYKALGIPWIPPELRENNGEIEAALEGKLPKLVERADIRCDVHMHTTASDGRHSIDEMAEAARKAGHDFIAITDHSKALAMANGLNEKRVLEQIAQVKEISKKLDGFTILTGSEVDILRDGRMDLDDEVLAQLDVVIASVHSYMNLEPAEMTDRLLRAMENPHVRIMGHPTGRILLRRDAYTYDVERVFNEAAKRGIRMEINACPDRLDLDATHLRAAKAKGLKFVISTDAHHIRHLDFMKYGVLMARRGWLGPEDVLNTLSVKDFQKAVKRAA